MKKTIFPFLVLFSALQISAQVIIDGTVLDYENIPIENVLVEIINEDDTSSVYSGVTDEQGYFSILTVTGLYSDTRRLPTKQIILSNYPNPFNPTTIIYYELSKSENIEIKIFDLLGREVKTLFNNFQKAGVYTLEWNGRNDWNHPVSAGIYFCRLKNKNSFKVHKMVLLDGGSYSQFIGHPTVYNHESINLPKVNERFYFSARISGNTIIRTDFQFLACSGDTTINFIVPRILQSAVIGPEGGQIITDDFSLYVPDGAFSESYEIKVARDNKYDDVFENPLTQTFRLEGFPTIQNKGITVKIKSTGQSIDSVALINIFDAFDPINGMVIDGIFDYEATQDSLGYLICNMPASTEVEYNKFNKAYDNDPSNPVWPFYRLKSLLGINRPIEIESEHFNLKLYSIISHLKFNIIKDTILVYSEKAINDFCNLFTVSANYIFQKFKEQFKKDKIIIRNCNYGKNERSDRPRPSSSLSPIIYKSVDSQSYSLYILYDAEIDPQDDILRDFYHYLYYIFPWVEYSDNFEKFYQSWFHHSVAAWSEELENSNNFVKPLDFSKYFNEPFDGIQSFSNEASTSFLENHGIGMSSLLKYFSNEYGNMIIGKFYNGLRENSNSLNVIIDTLAEKYNTPVTTWWPSFYKDYLQGNIYSIPGEEFLKNISETANFENGDTIKNISATYNDLSAKLFRVNINSNDLKTDGMLNFNINDDGINLDYVKILLFGINSNNLSFLIEGTNIEVGNLNYYDGLLACVVNSDYEISYNGTSNIELNIAAKKALPKANVNINAHFLVDLHVKTEDDEYDVESTDRVDNGWFGTAELINDSTYYCIWDADDQIGYHHTGRLKVIIDPYTNSLKYFEAEETQDGDGWTTITESIISNKIDIQPFSTSYDRMTFLIQGSDACIITSSFEYSKGNVSWNEYSTNFSCGDNSAVMIGINFDP